MLLATDPLIIILLGISGFFSWKIAMDRFKKDRLDTIASLLVYYCIVAIPCSFLGFLYIIFYDF